MKNRKSNIVLLIIFLFVLYVPTISFFFVKDKTSDTNSENRELARKPELSFGKLQSYPKEYDAYYNDNLPWRNSLVSIWRTLNFKVFDESIDDRVLIGKDKSNNTWLFYDNVEDSDEISFIDGRKKENLELVSEILDTMKEQTKVLKNNNIDLYYIVAPNKSTVYSEYLPNSINAKEDFFDKISKRLKENGINNLYYQPDLIIEKNHNYETYYRTDTHWNEYGACEYVNDFYYTIYNKKILENISVNQEIVSAKGRDLYKFAGFDFHIDDTSTKVNYSGKKKIMPKTEKKEYGNVEIYDNDDYKIDETVLLVGDSFTGHSLEYFYSVYKRVVRVYLNVCNYKQSIIEEYKPNKLFYLRIERRMPEALNMKFFEE